jgi:hypothetical protein
MEILITTFTLTTILVLAVIIGTKGRPMVFINALGKEIVLLLKNKVALLWTGLGIFLVLSFLYFFYASPATRIGPEQPIPFSHRVHAGVKAIQCRFCHPYVDRSIHPGLPPVEKCLFCHDYIITNHPWIQKEHDYFNTNTQTPWKKVFYVPEFVFFRHQRHMKKEIECQQCHGLIETMDRIPAKKFEMKFCVDCHNQEKASVGCWLACHN